MEFYIIDAFTSKPFSGNPAAVVLVTQHLPDSRLQEIASEVNLPETAYLWPLDDVEEPFKNWNRFKLRWFTPVYEVVLCGHATLSCGQVLFNEIGNKSNEISFDTKCGMLKVSKKGDTIQLDFPSLPGGNLTDDEEEKFQPLIHAVVGTQEVKALIYEPKTENLLICISPNITREVFDAIQPNYAAMKAYEGSNIKGIIITTKGNYDESIKRGFHNYNVVSRYFCPWDSPQEDPVTGSTHTILAPFWSKKLGLKELNCFQCSSRTGEMVVRVRKDERIDIIGKAVTVIRGIIKC